MRERIWKRGVISIPKMATSPFQSSVSTPAAQNKIEINLGFSDRFDYKKVFGVKITTPAYNGGTYSNPTVIQPLLRGTTLSYDFILLKGFSRSYHAHHYRH